MPGKIFITGGTGFLGAYIIKNLVEKGYKVKALRRGRQIPFFIDPAVFNTVEWVAGDLFDTVVLHEAMHGADAVIHAAAKVSFHRKERTAMVRTNAEGTANVVNAVIENNISRFVYISSVAAIGRTLNNEQVTESREWEENKLTTNYAISKHQAELEVWRGIGEGLNTVILNPSTIIGYGDWQQSSCAIFRNTYQQLPWYTKGMNGFVGVEDVARLTILLMESSIFSERFIINAENWTFQQLFNTIADGFRKQHPSREATPLLTKFALIAEQAKALITGKLPALTKETARLAHSHTQFDNSKILRAIPGFSFTPLRQVIENACKNYQEQLQPL